MLGILNNFSKLNKKIQKKLKKKTKKKINKILKKKNHFSCRGTSIWNTFLRNSRKETGLLSVFKSELKLKVVSFSIETMAKKRIEREVRNIKLTKKWFYDYSMVAFYESFFVSCLTEMDENLIVHNKKKYLWNVCFCNIWIFCEENIYDKWRFPFTNGLFINFSKRLISVI